MNGLTGSHNRVEAFICLYARMVDKDNLWLVLYALKVTPHTSKLAVLSCLCPYVVCLEACNACFVLQPACETALFCHLSTYLSGSLCLHLPACQSSGPSSAPCLPLTRSSSAPHLPLCLSLSVGLPVCLCACLSVCQPACLPVCLSVCLPARQLVCLSVCPSVRPSVCQMLPIPLA